MLPFLACVALTLSVGPASFSLRWSLAMGMLYIGQAALLRTLFMEQEFKVGYSLFQCLFPSATKQLSSTFHACHVPSCPPASGSLLAVQICQVYCSQGGFYISQALQVTEAELADGDSKFRELDGLTVHYKAAAPPGGLAKAAGGAPCGLAMYHGFGANTFSWSFVDRRLAEELGATVVSHDMPGFGLTQRSVPNTTQLLPC